MVIRRAAARLTQASTLKGAWRTKFVAVGAIVEIFALAAIGRRPRSSSNGLWRRGDSTPLTNAVRDPSPLLHLLQKMRGARQVGLAGVWLDVELFHHPVLDKHRIAL
jgi:hypothetical protein